jgi:hypothetical protein
MNSQSTLEKILGFHKSNYGVNTILFQYRVLAENHQTVLLNLLIAFTLRQL